MNYRRNKTLISICVPNYNLAHHLEDCIRSILTQTHRNLEIVIVDDASSDGSVEVIEGFDDPRIRLVRNAVNQGIAKVRNIALAHCRGAYVTSLDADDYYCSDTKLEAELDVLQFWSRRLRNVVAFSDIMRIDPGGARLELVSERLPIVEGRILDGLVERDIFIPRDYACLTALVRKVGGFREALTIFEDWDLKIRLAQRYRFYFSGVIGIAYRRRPDGLSAAPVARQSEVIASIRRSYGYA